MSTKSYVLFKLIKKKVYNIFHKARVVQVLFKLIFWTLFEKTLSKYLVDFDVFDLCLKIM